MLQILDSKKKKIAYFDNYKDLCIESVLNTGDSTLSFLYPLNGRWINYLIEENYIITKTNEYVIKAKRNSSDDIEITCKLNLEDLEGTPFDRYISEIQNITNALNLALVGTGWTVANNNISKKRTVIKTNCSSYDIIQEIKKIYRVDLFFDTLNKKIYVYENLGEDKGAYAIEKLNLVSLDVESDSYNYYTRIIPVGKDGLTIESINSGKKYVENFQYTSKIKTLYWTDERYTIPESLKEDAIAKLKDLSKPYRSYLGEIKNLAKLNKKYSSLEFNLGDTITLISKKNKIKDKQRIVKIIEYPQDHSKDSFEIANLVLRFEDQQDRFEEAAEIINNVTTDDGTINGDSIDEIRTDKIKNFTTEIGKVVNLEAVNAKINKLEVNKADIQSLNAVEAKIGTLEVTKASITELNATNANISNLQATKADITELNSAVGKIEILESESAKIGVLEGNLANIQDIIGGNISSENIQTGGITGDRLNMSTIFVSDANIVNINASKINSGEIDTSKIKIKSSDGAIEIAGATQQFKDKNNKVRIQMGKDTKGNFNFILRGEDGTTTLIDNQGIKEKAIADNLIKENMVAENAIGEKAINYNSFAAGFNKDTNTNILKATKVRLDNQNQTLDVAFTSLKNQSDNTKSTVESHTTELIVQQGKISTLISDTTITKEGQTVKLKDEYNKTVQTVNFMKNTINSHTTQIDANTSKITGVESKTNVLERDLNGMSSKLTSTQQTVGNLKIATTNLINNGDFSKGNSSWNSLSGIVKYQNKNCGYRSYSGTNEAFITSSRYSIDGGKEITLSFLAARTTNMKSFEVFILIRRKGSSTDYDYAPNKSFHLTEKLVKYEWTYKLPSDAESFYIRFDNNGSSDGENATLYITDVMFGEGNKSVSYVPSQYDVQSQIDINKDNITRVDTEVITTQNKVSTMSQNIDSIVQSINSIEKITTNHTSNLNNIDGKINIINEKVISNSTSIDLLKNKIALKVEQTDIEKTLAGVKIGSENLLSNSNFKKDVNFTSITSSCLISLVNEYEGRRSAYDGRLLFIQSKGVYGDCYASIGLESEIDNSKEYNLSFDCWGAGAFNNGESSSAYIWAIKKDGTSTPHRINMPTRGDKMKRRYNQTFKFPNDTVKISIRVGFICSAYAWMCFDGFKLVEGNKESTWSLSSKDLKEFAVTKINEAKSEIKVTTDNISQKVSKVESVTVTIKQHESRLTSAEQRITPDAIVNTVTASTTYRNDLTGKVSTSQVISSINQTAETIKINAKKIQLEGCTTVGTGGRRVQINNADYSALLNNQERMFWGFRDFENAYLVPKFYMGAYGFDTTQHNYFGITPYKGNGDNPQSSSSAYVDLSYRCINSNFKDWSNIKMSSDGRIRIAPIENLEITTNFLNGAYAGTGERRLALFATSTSSYFNSNLQIGCLRNMDNGNGLILADDQRSGYETRVRVNTDSSNNKFFRPLTNSGDIACGSASFPWKSIHTKSTYTIEALRCNRNISIRDVKINEIVDNIDFIQPKNVNESVIMDVSKISGTAFAPIQENVQTINTSELLKLALMEIKNLKQEIENIKTGE